MCNIGPFWTQDCLFLTPARPEESISLTHFAVTSNEYWQTRKCSREVALEVLNVNIKNIDGGRVEKLIRKNKSSSESELVGFYSLGEINDTNIELSHCFVNPLYIRKGVGSFLFHRAMERARNMGATRLYLTADPDAVDFYLKQGCAIFDNDKNLLNPSTSVKLMEIYI